LGLALEEVDVTHGVGSLLLGEVVGVGGASTGEYARMRLDEHTAVVEAHGGAIGTRTQHLADVMVRQGVESAVDLGMLIAADLGTAPERGVITLVRRRKQGSFLLRLEVLAWHPASRR